MRQVKTRHAATLACTSRYCAVRDIKGLVVLAILVLIVGLGRTKLVCAGAEPIATIRLKQEAEVAGISIVLGDIAEIEVKADEDGKASTDFASIYVGRAPLPGNSRQIAIGHIEVRLRQAGIHPSSVLLISPPSGSVKVSTQTQEVTAEMVVRAVEAKLSKDTKEGPRVAVEAGDGVPVAVPLGELELRVADMPTRLGTYRIGVDVYVDGERHRTIQARVEVTDPNALAPTNRASRGTEPVMVQKGERVVIEARSGAIVVKVQGIALQAGKLGDLIRVENAQSQEEIIARVVDSGIVVLEL